MKGTVATCPRVTLHLRTLLCIATGFQASYLVYYISLKKLEVRPEKYPSLGNQVDCLNAKAWLNLKSQTKFAAAID